MGIDFEAGRVLIDASVDAEEVRRTLKAHEPWRHKIDFVDGVSTADFQTFTPFNRHPSSKIQVAERHVGSLSGYKRALDVGCNAGYNSLYLAARYGMQVVGFDWSPRHVQVSQELARLAGVSGCRFVQGDAETFRDPEGFDLIIHFGTLYHLKNPVRAIENALANLRPGGLMLMESEIHGGSRYRGAEFIHGSHGDKTNWWALGPKTIVDLCAIFGAEAEQLGKRYLLKRGYRRAYFKVQKPRKP